MLRTLLISTVIASILILLTILTTITKAASVATLTSPATTAPTTTTTTTTSTTTTPLPITLTAEGEAAAAAAAAADTAFNISATVFELTKNSVVNKFLNNADEETTTPLLPLQPPLNVTSTTLSSFILKQKHQQEQQKQEQHLYLQKQRQYRQLQDVEETQNQQQQQARLREHVLNVNENGNKEIRKKNLDSSFVTVKSAVDIVTARPSSTHAYIPFDLDYNDPTEEKARPQTNSRQSTINEVLTNLFPKGFSDIFRFSYDGEQDLTASTTPKAPPLTLIRSTPTPFKRMPSFSTEANKKSTVPQNNTFITVSTTVTKEVRCEISPGHTEIVVEKIITDPDGSNLGEDFKDGSNSISKDDLLRINRAAKEASVLPSLLIKPLNNSTVNSNETKSDAPPIVILNEMIDDFVDAPEDDNQIAETQDVVHQVVQPPPAESTNYQVAPTHQYNVRIIHDNSLKMSLDKESIAAEQKVPPTKQEIPLGRSSPSYQTFVEQSKYLQNSLQEAPSRKFLKNFQNPIMNKKNNAQAVGKGNFHYEQGAQQNHIQAVAPVAPPQYAQYDQAQPPAEAQQPQLPQSHQYQELHTQIISGQQQQQQHQQQQQLSDKDIYQLGAEETEAGHSTPPTLFFVTINTPLMQAPAQKSQSYSQQPQVIPAQHMKSPHEFVSDAMGYTAQKHQLADHQAEQTENSPKPSNGGYTFVEVQKSINIHNKLITEKDGKLVEQHETIYPEQKYAAQQQQVTPEQHQPPPSPDYVSLAQYPIHVEQVEEQHEPAASVREEQHILNPGQHLENFGQIQQSNLVQESHIIEAPQQHGQEAYVPAQEQNLQHQEHNEHHEHPAYHEQHEHHEHQDLQEHSQPHEPPVVQEEQLTGEILPPPTHVVPSHIPPGPYAHTYQPVPAKPVVVQEVVEKHIPVPYGVPEPVGIPVHIQHFIDRPFPVETIVEKPVPYPVEKVVEKVVEKHVPVEVEKIVEKPVEVVVKKYIDRPVAIPIKIPVALHLPPPQHGPPLYGPTAAFYPPTIGAGLDHASTWPQPVSGGSFTRIPQSILKSYYVKMLKKLVPQMQQAYKTAHNKKAVPKGSHQPQNKPKFKISDILYDLKPPPPRSSSSWDVGARYQYDYNTLPLDLSASSSIAVGKHLERPGHGYKTNFDEFQRWRNGHNLKRSPDFGRNLHMEYGFKPPLVPSVEIDDKGVPLKAAADTTNGKQ